MIYSLLAVVALAFGLWALTPGGDAVQRHAVEVDSVAAYAGEQVDYPVYVPVGLPEGWEVTTVRLSTIAGQETWRIGVVSPAQEYAVLSQTQNPSDAWREAVLGETGSLGEVTLQGPDGPRGWQLWSGSGITALVLEPYAGQPATTVVHGSADRTELAEFAVHLEPRT